MRYLAFVLFGIAVTGVSGAQPGALEKQPEVTLRSGRKITNLEIVSVVGDTVMARWDGGRGTIAIADLPEELRAALPLPAPRPNPYGLSAPGTPTPPMEPAKEPPPLSSAPYDDPPKLAAKPALLERTVKGQVFITTQGAGSVKMGGLKIYVYPKEDFDALVAWMDRGPLAKARARKARMDFFDAEKRGNDWLAEYEKFKAVQVDAWTEMPPSPYMAQSDADGRFVVKHKAGSDFVVFAIGHRSLIKVDEFYVWKVASSKIMDTDNALLTGENCTDFSIDK